MIIDFIQNESVRSFHEMLTVALSGGALYYTYKLASFFLRSKKELSEYLKQEYWSDLALYVVTAAMGVFLFIDNNTSVWALVILRPYVILLNVIAMRRLFIHLKGQ